MQQFTLDLVGGALLGLLVANIVSRILKLELIFANQKTEDPEFLQVMEKDTTKIIADFLKERILALRKEGAQSLGGNVLDGWINEVKETKGIKGKDLFMGFRAVLTGALHGPDLKKLLDLTPLEIIIKRVA